MYYGVLSFDPHEPTKFLRIPNHTVATQVAANIMEWGDLCAAGLAHALQALNDPINVIRVLDMYRHMLATDVFKHGSCSYYHHEKKLKEHAGCTVFRPIQQHAITSNT